MWIGAQLYQQPEFVEITIGHFDLSANLAYDVEVSYSSTLLDSADIAQLELKVSNDCGVTWTTLWSKQGQNLATVSGLYSGVIFAPKANEWLKGSVDLSSYTGDSGVIVRMEFTPDASTYMCAGIFMDDFVLTSGPVGIDQLSNALEGVFSLYPNPANGVLNIGYEQLQMQSGEIEIINYLGKVVQRETLPAYTDKSQINISNLAGGVYFVRLLIGDYSSTQKLIIE